MMNSTTRSTNTPSNDTSKKTTPPPPTSAEKGKPHTAVTRSENSATSSPLQLHDGLLPPKAQTLSQSSPVQHSSSPTPSIIQNKRMPSFRTAINDATDTPPKILTNNSLSRTNLPSSIQSPPQLIHSEIGSSSSPPPLTTTANSATTASASASASNRPNIPLRHPSVSFSEVDSQERLRRFTISSQPSSTNIPTQNGNEYKSNDPNFPHQPVSSQTPIQQPSSNVPSRQTSLNRKKVNGSGENILFFGNNSQKSSSSNYGSALVSHSNSGDARDARDPRDLYDGRDGRDARDLVSNAAIGSTLPRGNASFDLHSGRTLNSPSPPPFERIPSGVSVFSPQSSSTNINSIVVPINISRPGSTNSSRRGSLKRAAKTIVSSPVGPPVPFQEYLSKEDDGKFHILLACTGSVATIKVPLIIDKLFQIFGTKIAIQLVVTKAASHFLRGSKINADVKIWRDEDEWTNYSETYATTTSTTASTNQNLSVVGKKPKNPYEKLILHNELRKWADIMLIAPLSANTLAKISNGIADNLLTSIARSWSPTTTSQQVKKPLIVAPAMNTFMYTHPITAKQLAIISSPEFGIDVLKPVEKILVCGDIGMGGMREWTDIVDILRRKVLAIKAERKRLDEAEDDLVEEDEEEDDDDEEEDGEDDLEDENDEGDDDDDDDDDEDDDDDHDEDAHDKDNGGDGGKNKVKEFKTKSKLGEFVNEVKETLSPILDTKSLDSIEFKTDDEGNEELIFEADDNDHELGLSPSSSHRQQRIKIPKETQNII